MPLSQRSNRRSILARIYLTLHAPSVFVKTTWAKTRGLSEFHLRSSNPRHSAARTEVNRRPTFPRGVEYHLADCTASHLHLLCHLASSGTHPARCVPSLWWGNSPYTSRNDRCVLVGVNPCRSVPFLRGGGRPPSSTDIYLLCWSNGGFSTPLPAVPGALPSLGRPVRLL